MRRREGHSVIERLAYIGRQRLVSVRTGDEYDYSARGDLAGDLVTLLPAGAPSALADASALWSAVDAAATHKHDALGLDLVLALPPPTELDPELSRQMLETFLAETILSHGLALSYAVHQPHVDYDTDELAADLLLSAAVGAADPFSEAMRAGRLHLHAHVLVTPRQLGPLGLAPRRYHGIDPTVRNGVVVDALNWGLVWGLHQNRFFAEYGRELRVRPRALFGAAPVPLPAVRKWRRKLRGEPDVVGRALLAHPEFEKANAEALRSIDAALEALDRPFTRGELLSLAKRYLVAEEARELTDAVIGVAGVIELGDGSGAGSRWLASLDLIRTELAAIGRAAALAARSRRAAAIPDLGTGLSTRASELLKAVAAGLDLVVIEAHANPGAMLEDLARLAERMGRKPVSIAHGSGSMHPAAIIVTARKLPIKQVSDAVVLVDQADALDATELDLIIQAALAGNCQLVLVRRPGGIWPRSPLLDLVAQRATRLNWGKSESLQIPELIRHGDHAAVAEQLATSGATIGAHGPGILDAAIAWAETRARAGRRVIILASSEDRVASLNAQLQRARLRAIATQYLPTTVMEPVLALVRRPARGGPLLAGQLARAPDLTLLVDRDTTPTDTDLVAHLALDLPLSAAVTQGVAAWQLPTGAVLRPVGPALPRFAVDWAGTPMVDPGGIRDSVAFWASAPLDLEWAQDFKLTDADVLAALAAEPTEPTVGPVLVNSTSTVAEEATAGPDPGRFDGTFELDHDVRPFDLPDLRDADREDDFGPDGPPDDDYDWEEWDWDDGWVEDDAPGPENDGEGY